MALNPSGIMSIGGPSTGSSINLELGLSATANSSLNQADFRTLAGIPSGVISLSNFYGKSNVQFTVRGVFFGGTAPGTNVRRNTSNVVTNTGVIGADTANASATARTNSGQGHTYGGDKAMFFSGIPPSSSTALGSQVLFSNTGVFAAQNASPSIARTWGAMCSYGTTGTAIAFWGSTSTNNNTITAQQNLISNTGVVAASTATAAGTPRHRTMATNYSADRSVGIAGFGDGVSSAPLVSNLVSNTGVIAADVTVPSTTLKYGLSATRYGTTGQSYFCGGRTTGNVSLNTYNPISNTGTVSGNLTYTGTARFNGSCAPFASDGQAMFAWGSSPDNNTYNLISNTGVIGGNNSMAGGQAVRSNNAGAGVSYT
jgi:hypothetical protein